MKLPFGWSHETLGTIISYAGVGFMALGVGMEYSLTGAIAVFALGLPILAIQQHMRAQQMHNMLVLQALVALQHGMEVQVTGHKLARASMAEVRDLLKRIADEGITRE
jgi:hypothetical protein